MPPLYDAMGLHQLFQVARILQNLEPHLDEIATNLRGLPRVQNEAADRLLRAVQIYKEHLRVHSLPGFKDRESL